jgi:hypothetical protein
VIAAIQPLPEPVIPPRQSSATVRGDYAVVGTVTFKNGGTSATTDYCWLRNRHLFGEGLSQSSAFGSTPHN